MGVSLNEGVIKNSFLKVKEDISSNAQLISKLTDTIKRLENKIDNLTKENISLKSVPVESSLSKQEVLAMLNSLKSEMSSRKDPIKTEFVKKIQRNKKSIIKQKILDLISFKQLTVPELKEIIVDQNEYCSKASFYRYYEELKNRNLINQIEVNGTQILTLPIKHEIRTS